MNKTSIINSLIICCCLQFSGALCAHQMKHAMTVINFNDRTHNLEVVHRIEVHDAEVVVKNITGQPSDLFKDKQLQAELAAYIESNFSVVIDDGLPLELQSVGHAIEGLYFWVYQEIQHPKPVDKITVVNRAMMDVWPDQRNLINIEGLDTIRSMTLEKGKESQTIEFE
jgi:hypothetical protein